MSDSGSDARCEGPLIWFDTEGGAILECAAPTCDYLIVTGNFNDDRHCGTPILREGLAT